MDIQPGQRLLARVPVRGLVEGTVRWTNQDHWYPDRLAVHLDVAGELVTVHSTMCTPIEETPMTATTKTAATEAPAKRKPGRPKKVQPETPNDTVVSAQAVPGDTAVSAQANEISAEATGMPSEAQLAKLTATMHGATVPPAWTGALGLFEVPISQCVRSACNVRHHYDPAAIEELADSLHSQGQQQNASGRWTADGQIEIVAGESRRRAQLLRVERGQITDAAPFLVRISEMTDAEALEISATENMRRRSMTPLEECEAMAALQDAGRTVEAITATFGYKTQQPVADRILAARNLLTKAREALDAGQMSLAQAFVIARAPGKDLQNSMTSSATDLYRPQSAAELSKVFTRGQMLVKTAGFNVEKSGLEVVRDIFDTFEPYFKDKAKALQAQVEHANGLAEKRRAKGDRAFVAVETGEYSTMPMYSHKLYESASEKATDAGTVFYICTASGTLAEEKGVRLRKAAKATVKEDGSVETTKAERQMPESAYLEAHQLRAYAAREAAVGDTHLTLALTVWGMLLGQASDVGRSHINNVQGLPNNDEMAALMPTLHARREALRTLIAPVENSRSYSSQTALGGHTPQADPLLTLLLGLENDELLGHLNTLVAVTAYDWSQYNPKEEVRSEYAQIAHLTDAPRWLANSFTLTDEWLKRYPRGDLIKLAEEAGLGRALVEDCKTLKEMRGRILEHAERLHAEGFVPALLRFPEPLPPLPAAEAAQPSAPDDDDESDEDLDEEGSEDDTETKD